MPSATILTEPLRRTLAGTVRRTFNDQAKGERPVVPSDNALIPRSSVAWRVHGDVTTMMIGGISGLLLQMLHPPTLAGVWDHSNFREDMIGRLRRTERFIATTTYGDRADAEAMIVRVRAIHSHVQGVLPDGRAYAADDPRLLAWVHAAGELSFLHAWIRYCEPGMSRDDQDRFFEDVSVVAVKLGADPIPRSLCEAETLIAEFRSELHSSDRSRVVRDHILSPPGTPLAALPIQRVLSAAAVDLLPSWARRMHGLRSSGLAAPLLRSSVHAVGGSLRWALRRT